MLPVDYTITTYHSHLLTFQFHLLQFPCFVWSYSVCSHAQKLQTLVFEGQLLCAWSGSLSSIHPLSYHAVVSVPPLATWKLGHHTRVSKSPQVSKVSDKWHSYPTFSSQRFAFAFRSLAPPEITPDFWKRVPSSETTFLLSLPPKASLLASSIVWHNRALPQANCSAFCKVNITSIIKATRQVMRN